MLMQVPVIENRAIFRFPIGLIRHVQAVLNKSTVMPSPSRIQSFLPMFAKNPIIPITTVAHEASIGIAKAWKI